MIFGLGSWWLLGRFSGFQGGVVSVLMCFVCRFPAMGMGYRRRGRTTVLWWCGRRSGQSKPDRVRSVVAQALKNRSSADPEPGQHHHAGVGGPLADRDERARPAEHRRQCHRQD